MNKFKVGITGHTGFIGSHLVERLARDLSIEVILLDDALFNCADRFKALLQDIDCIVHLAGMNRGPEEEVYSTNIALAQTLVSCLAERSCQPRIIFSSSIWSTTETAFGRSKKEAGCILESWAKSNQAALLTLIIPNVFGDNGKPFYNSVVATFCYQLARGDQPQIIQDREIDLIYINDLVEYIYREIKAGGRGIDLVRVPATKTIMVSELRKILEGFQESFSSQRIIPVSPDPFLVNLYNVFLSYIKPDELAFVPEVRSDERGELFELIKLGAGGQVFFSITKPGIIRGNHYHTRKIERFCVIKGTAVIRLRRIGTREIKEYPVAPRVPQFVDIPIFHAHQIENTGNTDLFTLFWCNELFDQKDSDTYFEEV